MNKAEALLVELVSTPSVSGDERAAAEVFVTHAHGLGLHAEIDEAGNALAHRGGQAAAVHIMLLGHIDTVGGHIPVRVDDGILSGRGSVDAKGPLAAMLVAAAAAELPEGVHVTVAGAVGEETARSPGARHLATQFRPTACIIGEPSGWDGVTLGYKGRLLAKAVAACSCAHSAGPEPSACDAVSAWWSGVRSEVAAFNLGRSRQFDLIQASLRAMGSSSDGLEQSAWMQAGFRLPPGVDPNGFADRIRRATPEHVRIHFEGAEVAVVSDRNDPVVRALSGAIRSAGAAPRPKLKTGTSDMNVVAPIWRCPIAAYGPGDSALDHTPGERLSLAEYHRSIEVLASAIRAIAREQLDQSRGRAAAPYALSSGLSEGSCSR